MISKFRIWREDLGEFEYWGYLEPGTFKGVPSIPGMSIDSVCQESNMVIPGLQDISGKEMYPGDYIQSTSGKVYIIKYRENYGDYAVCFTTYNQSRFKNLTKTNITRLGFKVVGNIHNLYLKSL